MIDNEMATHFVHAFQPSREWAWCSHSVYIVMESYYGGYGGYFNRVFLECVCYLELMDSHSGTDNVKYAEHLLCKSTRNKFLHPLLDDYTHTTSRSVTLHEIITHSSSILRSSRVRSSINGLKSVVTLAMQTVYRLRVAK